eukprot:2083-Chlamydomonas_euryale.AAC.2
MHLTSAATDSVPGGRLPQVRVLAQGIREALQRVCENRDRGRVEGFCFVCVLAGDGPPAPKQDPQLGFRVQPRGEGLPHEQIEEGGQQTALPHPCNPHAHLRLHRVRVPAGLRVSQQQAHPTQHTL